MDRQIADSAISGDYVGLLLNDLSIKDVKRGYVASHMHNDPATDIEMISA